MPHVLIERQREPIDGSFKQGLAEKDVDEERERWQFRKALAVEIADLLSGVVLTLGSMCFYPSLSQHVAFFKYGCACFIIGGVVYTIISLYTFIEALNYSGRFSLEPFENLLYLLGSLSLVAGSVLYWPGELLDPGDKSDLMVGKNIIRDFNGIGVYMNTFQPAFEGSMMFIIGCLFFAFAAFVNAMSIQQFHNVSNQLLAAVTSFNMVGGLLYVMGSIAFLPDYGCSEAMAALGATAYTLGSCVYTLGGCVTLYRAATLDTTPKRREDPTGRGTPRNYLGVRMFRGRRSLLPTWMF